MTFSDFKEVAEAPSNDLQTLRAEVLISNQPVVMRGLINDWPLTAKSKDGPKTASEFLMSYYKGKPLMLLTGHPAIKGRFFYRDDMSGLNFQRTPVTMNAGLQQLLLHFTDPEPPAIYMESTPVMEYLPGFVETHPMPLLNQPVAPRIWIGNAITVQTHFDLSQNIACLAAGKRRFVLFPPEQLPNLYIGPLDFTLSGPPVSMVSLKEPDFARYPKFRTAMNHAQVANLEPGDAIYIPYGWWHHVESLTPFNILINYWWNDTRANMPPFDSLLHGIGALRDLPVEQRKVWRELFDYYVFQMSGEPLTHLPPDKRGLLGPLTPQRIVEIKKILQQAMQR